MFSLAAVILAYVVGLMTLPAVGLAVAVYLVRRHRAERPEREARDARERQHLETLVATLGSMGQRAQQRRAASVFGAGVPDLSS